MATFKNEKLFLAQTAKKEQSVLVYVQAIYRIKKVYLFISLESMVCNQFFDKFDK
jgi:hypothetical protein